MELMLDTPWLTATLVVGLLAIAAAAVFARHRQTREPQELDLEQPEFPEQSDPVAIPAAVEALSKESETDQGKDQGTERANLRMAPRRCSRRWRRRCRM